MQYNAVILGEYGSTGFFIMLGISSQGPTSAIDQVLPRVYTAESLAETLRHLLLLLRHAFGPAAS